MHGEDHAHPYESFIWGHDPISLKEQPLIDPTTWAGAIQRETVSFGTGATLHTPDQPGPAYAGAAVVMMAKDEADIIGENLVWLYATGARRFIIDDNGSTDATAVIIERFRRARHDVELLVLKDPIVRYMQAEKTTGLFRLALSIWPDLRWVVPVDADEFLIAERGLGVLDAVDGGVDAVAIPKAVHFRPPGAVHAGGSIMGKMDHRSPMFCVPPKIITRTNILTTITQGNHKVRLLDNRPPVYAGGFGLGLYYREFPTRSFEHFLRKIRNGGPAVKAAELHLATRSAAIIG